ncbi:MAG: phosphoribosylformylglycinamidine synthase II, partial [Deltaproteobacteria bacterium]|nr:phosphoribosylformylglycinamidine synthase II [Deltaproteobacteria bacterium]
DVSKHVTAWFKRAGDAVFLLGELAGGLGAGEYLSFIHGKTAGEPPPLDLAREKALQDFLLSCIDQGLIRSAHDVSDGGLAVALAEACLVDPAGAAGVEISLAPGLEGRKLAELFFGEGASRILVSVAAEQAATLEQLAAAAAQPLVRLGQVRPGAFKLGPYLDLPMDRLRGVWEDGFEKLLKRN